MYNLLSKFTLNLLNLFGNCNKKCTAKKKMKRVLKLLKTVIKLCILIITDIITSKRATDLIDGHHNSYPSLPNLSPYNLL